jgi:hypothetical protein
MSLVRERIPSDVILKEEKPGIADVICTRCGAQIGRLQTTPAEAKADMEEIYAEIRLIADEHRGLCAEIAK